LLDEDDFADDEEVFLLELAGVTVTVDFFVVTGDEEAVLVELVNFKILERVSFLLETGWTLETGLGAVGTFCELLLLTFLELLLTLLELLLLLLLIFLELVDTLVLEDFFVEEIFGRENVVVGLTVVTLTVPEAPTVAESPMLSRGSRLSRRTFSATSSKLSSLLSLEFKGAARMRAGAKRPKMAA